MQTSGRHSSTGHEKYIPRDRQNATKEKVENLLTMEFHVLLLWAMAVKIKI